MVENSICFYENYVFSEKKNLFFSKIRLFVTVFVALLLSDTKILGVILTHFSLMKSVALKNGFLFDSNEHIMKNYRLL